MGIFSIDNPLFRFMDKLSNIVILSILWTIFSLPIVTIGASTTALHYVTMKLVKNEEGYMIKDFWKSFKMNFKQATAIWLILLAIISILYVDINYWLDSVSGIFSTILIGITFSIGLICIFIMLYSFPVLARFDNTVKNTMINALCFAMRHLWYTIFMILLIASVAAFLYISDFVALIFPLIGSGFIAYTNSVWFVKIFKNYEPKPDIVGTENGIDTEFYENEPLDLDKIKTNPNINSEEVENEIQEVESNDTDQL